MHGGNAGMVGLPLERGREEESSKERRLDDFWQMTLLRSAPGYLLVAQLLSLFIGLVQRKSCGGQRTSYGASS